MRRHRLFTLVVVAAFLAGCGPFGGGDVKSGVQEGAELPDAEFTTMDGDKVRVHELRGQPVVINFWATWCGPCRDEIPLFQKAYAERSGEFQMLAVTDEARGDVSSFLGDFEMGVPVFFDPSGRAGQRYRIQGIPTTFFLDRNGVIVARYTGAISAGRLKLYLDRIVNSTTQPDEPTQAPSLPTSPVPGPTAVPPPPASTPAPLPNSGDDSVGWRPTARA